MRWILFVLFISAAATAEAGPFRRNVARTSSSACSGGNCVSARTVTRSHGARGHAESMAASCSMVHSASHDGTYEGVGVGGSPEAALAECCNNGRAVVEEGVARGRDGRWYACRRYSLR